MELALGRERETLWGRRGPLLTPDSVRAAASSSDGDDDTIPPTRDPLQDPQDTLLAKAPPCELLPRRAQLARACASAAVEAHSGSSGGSGEEADGKRGVRLLPLHVSHHNG